MNFFIYPDKDTTLYKKRKLRLLNSGIDEVIELTSIFSEVDGHDVSRILLKFNVDAIDSQSKTLKNATEFTLFCSFFLLFISPFMIFFSLFTVSH